MRTLTRPVLLLLATLAFAPLAHAATAYAPTPVNGGAGSVTTIAHWQIQDSAKAQEGGAAISAAGFSTRDW